MSSRHDRGRMNERRWRRWDDRRGQSNGRLYHGGSRADESHAQQRRRNYTRAIPSGGLGLTSEIPWDITEDGAGNTSIEVANHDGGPTNNIEAPLPPILGALAVVYNNPESISRAVSQVIIDNNDSQVAVSIIPINQLTRDHLLESCRPPIRVPFTDIFLPREPSVEERQSLT
ncbi:hypothetical protein AAL_08045 [Moelleriella libera RCEF 2490]|uniref:Uncharacterized protein n=1 Tax=Moelleriella libera RCEF 2490 TaxID=1081109 RepID=A0A167W7D3_9HYPO|nr:hypothetical protein AAL_08045 [Moelleriella libera RCEF 2490]